MRLKLLELQKIIEIEVKKAEIAAGKNKSASDEVGHGMTASYSVAGDVEHAKNTALLSQQKLEQLIRLSEEIAGEATKELLSVIEPACYFSVKADDGSLKKFYFVRNPVYIPGLNFVSPDSPVGKTVSGKSIGFSFSSGIILEIG